MRIQRLIDLGAASLRQILEEEPWVAAMRHDPKRYKTIEVVTSPEQHPGEIADSLQLMNGQISSLGTSRHGVDRRAANSIVRNQMPGIIAIGRSYGLDMSAFESNRGNLPGMRDGSESALSVVAERVHLLANRWRRTDRSGVDPLLAIEADAAAGRDLDDLEAVWRSARETVEPARIPDLDASYQRATSSLENTLAMAIAAAGNDAVDALRTHAGYIEAKHGYSSPEASRLLEAAG